jgi:hypothetical protein
METSVFVISLSKSLSYIHTYIHYITLHSMDPKLAKMTVGCGISHTITINCMEQNSSSETNNRSVNQEIPGKSNAKLEIPYDIVKCPPSLLHFMTVKFRTSLKALCHSISREIYCLYETGRSIAMFTTTFHLSLS